MMMMIISMSMMIMMIWIIVRNGDDDDGRDDYHDYEYYDEEEDGSTLIVLIISIIIINYIYTVYILITIDMSVPSYYQENLMLVKARLVEFGVVAVLQQSLVRCDCFCDTIY